MVTLGLLIVSEDVIALAIVSVALRSLVEGFCRFLHIMEKHAMNEGAMKARIHFTHLLHYKQC